MSTALFVPRALSFAVAAGNHALTVRATYTVPAGKNAELEGGNVYVRESIASALASAGTSLKINGVAIVFVNTLNAIGERVVFFSGRIFLQSGDVITLESANASGNALPFGGSAFIREFQ